LGDILLKIVLGLHILETGLDLILRNGSSWWLPFVEPIIHHKAFVGGIHGYLKGFLIGGFVLDYKVMIWGLGKMGRKGEW
jgi:hypothetical protein